MKHIIQERNWERNIASASEETFQELEGCWYFLPEDVDMTHLTITDRTYTCPYKGVCHWIDLHSSETQAKNVAWVYRNPKPGYEIIAGRIGFYGRDTSGTVALTEQDETIQAKK